ncbi:MAG TPA: hypothetical protein DD384_06385 [Firmicutes bacterium]|nr:hypothetical protein [Bacillota bacterium]
MPLNIELWQFILYIVLALIIGAAAGFFGARALIKREMKKNPPINEKMIRAMFAQMGRKPSEAQIRSVMNSMNKNQ